MMKMNKLACLCLFLGGALAACGGGSHGSGVLPPQTRGVTSIRAAATPNPCPPTLGIPVNGSIFETGQIVNLTAVYQTYVQKIVLGRERCEPSTSSTVPAKWSTTGGSLVVLNGGRAANFSSSSIGTFTITAKYLTLSAQAALSIQLHNETFIADFPQSSDGNLPFGPVLRDSRGNFFGVTTYGAATSGCFCGTVYEVEHTSTGYVRRLLYVFQGGTDGAFASGALAADPSGDLFGTTVFGGLNGGAGTVFELKPSGTGYRETVIYRFTGGADGAHPAGVIRDANGNLYGTSTDQYSYANGFVYKLAPSGSGFSERVIHSFQGGTDGLAPSSLTLGPNGALYGTTDAGGNANNDGTVFELTPSGTTYSERILYRFQGGSDGRAAGTIIVGNNGTLYGTTKGVAECGGQTLGLCGTVFELAPSGSSYQERVLYRFRGSTDGSDPKGLLLANGVLYGTTDGSAYSLTVAGSFHLIHIFCGNFVGEACFPNGPLVRDTTGALYGSSQQGGGGNHGGTVFRLTP